VNLLPEVGVGVDLTMLGRCSGETLVGGTGSFVEFDASVSAFPSETNEFHKRLSVSRLTAPNPRETRNHLREPLSTAASLQVIRGFS
jgi:hypothetical protein